MNRQTCLALVYISNLVLCLQERVRVNKRYRFPPNVCRFPLPLPRLVALPTEAWRGAENCRCSAENSYVNLPGPYGKDSLHGRIEHFWHSYRYFLGAMTFRIKTSSITTLSIMMLSIMTQHDDIQHYNGKMQHISKMTLTIVTLYACAEFLFCWVAQIRT